MWAKLKPIARIILAGLMVLAGVMHFVQPEWFARIVPPYLPAPYALVYVSGVFEILGGVGLVVQRTRRLAALGIIALLLAVFPANVHMALHPEQFMDLAPEWGLWLRLPGQAVLILWAWWVRHVTPAKAS